MLDLFVRWRKAGLLLVLFVAACGGGGSNNDSDPGSAGVEASTNSLSFKADSPTADTPASQVVSITFGSNIAHLGFTHIGAGVGDVTSTISGRTAQVTIAPAAPAAIGPGLFESKVAITGYVCADANCSAFAAGGTQTITVSYQVSPLVLYVAPYVLTSQASSAVVVRGIGFTKFNLTGVQVGSVNATSFVVTDDSQLVAQVPALAAGTYPVTLVAPAHEGAVPTQASLLVLDPVTYSAQAISYSAPVTTVNSVIYDAERGSILVATDAANNELQRLSYAGGTWSAQGTAAIPTLHDVALSINGTSLYALTDTQLTMVDPSTLAIGSSFAASPLASNQTLRSLAVSSTDTAYITSASTTSGEASPIFGFSERVGSIVRLAPDLNFGTASANAAGTELVFMQGDPASTDVPVVYIHSGTDASSSLTDSGVTFHQNAVRTALDRVGSRIVLNGGYVYDGSFSVNESFPIADAVVLNPAGTRVYAYYAATNSIETYDVTTLSDGASITSLGSTSLTGNPGANPKMTVTPDGNALILAGPNQIVVQPTPTF